jgi:fluoride ion exporter CrcB/FEX
MLIQAVSVFGAVMVLIAYAMIQSGIWRELDSGYLALNIVGSLLLGIVAIVERQIGFILLEFTWAGLGAWGVARAWRARTRRS